MSFPYFFNALRIDARFWGFEVGILEAYNFGRYHSFFRLGWDDISGFAFSMFWLTSRLRPQVGSDGVRIINFGRHPVGEWFFTLVSSKTLNKLFYHIHQRMLPMGERDKYR